MKYNEFDFVDSTTVPNDYISYSVKKRRIPKRFSSEKRFDLLDILMVPTALVMAVSIGFLVYQITKVAGDTSIMTGLLSVFGK